MNFPRRAFAALTLLVPATALVAQQTPPATEPPSATPAAGTAAGPATRPGDAAFPPSTQAMAGLPTTGPASQPTGDAAPVPAATAIAAPGTITTPIAAARDYFSLIKAGAPRVATSTYVDFDTLATRCFGNDYKNANALDQAEIRELLRSVIFIGYTDPRVSALMTQLTYENFTELPATPPAAADTRDLELEASGTMMPNKVKQRLTFAQVNGQWRIVDLWQNTTTLSQQLGTLWGQAKSQVTLINFCRIIIVPQRQQQPQGGPQQGPQGAPGPQGPAGPSVPSTPTAPPAPPVPTVPLP